MIKTLENFLPLPANEKYEKHGVNDFNLGCFLIIKEK